MYRLDYWRVFVTLAVLLIGIGIFRSAWATRLDGFTIDEPWHITAGGAYLRTGEYYLNASAVTELGGTDGYQHRALEP